MNRSHSSHVGLIAFAAVSLIAFAGVSVAKADEGVNPEESTTDAFHALDAMQQEANDRMQQLQQQSIDNAQREADEAHFRAQQAGEQRRLDSLALQN